MSIIALAPVKFFHSGRRLEICPPKIVTYIQGRKVHLPRVLIPPFVAVVRLHAECYTLEGIASLGEVPEYPSPI